MRALVDRDPPRTANGIDERRGNVTTIAVAAEKAEPGIGHAPFPQPAGADAAPLPSLEPNAGPVAREDLGAATLRDREAARQRADTLDDHDATSPKCGQREAAAQRPGCRQLDLQNLDARAHARVSRPAAAATACDGGEKEETEEYEPQPVHPIRRTPLKADWLRYVSSKRFVPQASHFASMI